MEKEEKQIAERETEQLYRRKIYSVKKMLTIFIISGWVIPVIIIFIAMTVSYRKGIIHKTEALLKDELKIFTTLTAFKLDEAITTSKDISYDKTIEISWKGYKEGIISQSSFYKTASNVMRSKFYTNTNINAYMFYLIDEPDLYYPNTNANTIYMTPDVIKEADIISKHEDPSAQVRVINGEVYIIRNMYTVSNYTKYGTMILSLNKRKLFTEISNEVYDLSFFINGSDSRVVNSREELTEDEGMTDILDQMKGIYRTYNNNRITAVSDDHENYEGYLNEQRYKDYHIGAVLIVESDKVYTELGILNRTITIILLFIIPVLLLVVYFITCNITTPIAKMVDASKKLKSGQIGMQIEDGPMPNQEFEYLRESFNKMSKELKYLFDYAYNEKLARKDAKIMALQSQINPHFLNNTLEMMNWQARMAGDVNVSKMIEALSTLLDYSMDRTNKRLISLADEIRCGDAYFYIISMRFGQRLTVSREIDESLLRLQVPQLILQPLLENAVTHGIETVNRGSISLKAFRQDNNVLLQVINTGKPMTEKDVERVKHLLNGRMDQIDQGAGKHVSLGIRNVNERIRLIYGNEYGLTIRPMDNGDTAATITIPFEQKQKLEKEDLMKNIMEISK